MIAISCACGPLHKWGYQWTAYECIASQAEFADRVYLIQSTADSTGIDKLLNKYSNITLISDPSTWHHKPGEGDEALTIMDGNTMSGFTKFHMRNLAIGRWAATKDGHKVIMSTHSNWYVPRRNIETLREYCLEFKQNGATTGYGWAMGQVHDRLHGPPVRREALYNPTGLSEAVILASYPDMKARHIAQAEIPPNVNNLCLVDASYNLLPEEFEGMQKRFHYPGNETWNWPNYKAALIDRMKRRYTLGNEPLDYWGQEIAKKSTPDFMGYQLLQGVTDGW